MCKITDTGVLGLDNECCGNDPDDCTLTTVEGDMLKEACDEVIETLGRIKELVDEGDGDERAFTARCIDLTIEVGELVRQVVEYTEPDAGLESI